MKRCLLLSMATLFALSVLGCSSTGSASKETESAEVETVTETVETTAKEIIENETTPVNINFISYDLKIPFDSSVDYYYTSKSLDNIYRVTDGDEKQYEIEDLSDGESYIFFKFHISHNPRADYELSQREREILESADLTRRFFIANAKNITTYAIINNENYRIYIYEKNHPNDTEYKNVQYENEIYVSSLEFFAIAKISDEVANDLNSISLAISIYPPTGDSGFTEYALTTIK